MLPVLSTLNIVLHLCFLCVCVCVCVYVIEEYRELLTDFTSGIVLTYEATDVRSHQGNPKQLKIEHPWNTIVHVLVCCSVVTCRRSERGG